MTKHPIKKYNIRDTRGHIRGSIIISKNDNYENYDASVLLDEVDGGKLDYLDTQLTGKTEDSVLEDAIKWIKTKIPITEITSFKF